MGSAGWNSGPHTCVASTLSTVLFLCLLIFQELARYFCFPGERQRNMSNLYSSMLSTEPYSLLVVVLDPVPS